MVNVWLQYFHRSISCSWWFVFRHWNGRRDHFLVRRCRLRRAKVEGGVKMHSAVRTVCISLNWLMIITIVTSGQSSLTNKFRIVTAHGRYCLYLTMCRPFTPSNLPLPIGDLDSHLIHGSLGLPESTSQRASWSVQPFLQGSWSWQTSRQTDLTTPFVTVGRICIHCTATWPNNSNIHISVTPWSDIFRGRCCCVCSSHGSSSYLSCLLWELVEFLFSCISNESGSVWNMIITALRAL